MKNNEEKREKKDLHDSGKTWRNGKSQNEKWENETMKNVEKKKNKEKMKANELGPKELQHNDFAQVLCAQNLSLVECVPRNTNNTNQKDTTTSPRFTGAESIQVACIPRDISTNTFKRDTWTLPRTSGLKGGVNVQCETHNTKVHATRAFV